MLCRELLSVRIHIRFFVYQERFQSRGPSSRTDYLLRSARMHAAERKAAEKAHEQAEHDIDEDPDFSIHSPNDDLDEGETARLGEDIPLI